MSVLRWVKRDGSVASYSLTDADVEALCRVVIGEEGENHNALEMDELAFIYFELLTNRFMAREKHASVAGLCRAWSQPLQARQPLTPRRQRIRTMQLPATLLDTMRELAGVDIEARRAVIMAPRFQLPFGCIDAASADFIRGNLARGIVPSHWRGTTYSPAKNILVSTKPGRDFFVRQHTSNVELGAELERCARNSADVPRVADVVRYIERSMSRALRA